MAQISQFRVLFVTAPDRKLAETIAQKLVERKLAACVSVVPGITSFYRWEDKLHQDAEVLLLIKTRAGIIREVTQFIKEAHPAQAPEIIALPIMEGSPAYLDWLAANTLFAKAEEPKLPM